MIAYGWHESPHVSPAARAPPRSMHGPEYILNLVPYFSITEYLIDTMVVIWIQQIINYDP